jgi:hypothetical protein
MTYCSLSTEVDNLGACNPIKEPSALWSNVGNDIPRRDLMATPGKMVDANIDTSEK